MKINIGILGLLGLLGIVFITLKLLGHIDWEWYLVLLPFYFQYLIIFVASVLTFFTLLFIEFFKFIKKRK